jgi:hypothetical protein
MNEFQRRHTEYEVAEAVKLLVITSIFIILWITSGIMLGGWYFPGSYFLFAALTAIIITQMIKKVTKFYIVEYIKEHPESKNNIDIPKGEFFTSSDTPLLAIISLTWIVIPFYLVMEEGEILDKYFIKPWLTRRAEKRKEKLINEVQKENPELFL